MENVITPDPKDAADNKVMGILAYLGILFLVPLLAAKESPFARFHANQGLLVCIVGIASGVVVTILSLILVHILPALVMVLYILYIPTIVLAIMGIINANNGEMKELPIIGKYRLIK